MIARCPWLSFELADILLEVAEAMADGSYWKSDEPYRHGDDGGTYHEPPIDGGEG